MQVELREEPQLPELDEDRGQARELRVLGLHRPQLPSGENRERDRDLGRDRRGVVDAPAQPVASRWEGCQRSARRSIAEKTT